MPAGQSSVAIQLGRLDPPSSSGEKAKTEMAQDFRAMAPSRTSRKVVTEKLTRIDAELLGQIGHGLVSQECRPPQWRKIRTLQRTSAAPPARAALPAWRSRFTTWQKSQLRADSSSLKIMREIAA
jgi:hypothetical protein